MEHEAVAEAAVVGTPHPVKGESLYCFVTLTDGVTYNRSLEAELKKQGGQQHELNAVNPVDLYHPPVAGCSTSPAPSVTFYIYLHGF